MVDGIPLTMPDGQTNLNNVDLGSAGSIHVLRGPASSLFGNAAGGVIAALEAQGLAGRERLRVLDGELLDGQVGHLCHPLSVVW